MFSGSNSFSGLNLEPSEEFSRIRGEFRHQKQPQQQADCRSVPGSHPLEGPTGPSDRQPACRRRFVAARRIAGPKSLDRKGCPLESAEPVCCFPREGVRPQQALRSPGPRNQTALHALSHLQGRTRPLPPHTTHTHTPSPTQGCEGNNTRPPWGGAIGRPHAPMR